MDSMEILATCQRLERAMADRGMVMPTVHLSVNWIGEAFSVSIRRGGQETFYGRRGLDGDQEVAFLKGDTAEEALAAAEAYIAAIPDPAKEAREQFVRALSGLVDRGREFGVSEELIVPVLSARDLVNERLLTFDQEAV